MHSSVEYVVWFLGFQPGFPYLGSLPEQLHTPRRAEPRLHVPAGSVGILELEPPVTLASQKRIWRLAQRRVDMPNVVEAIPGMNNITVILRNPESLALDARERLQRWWEESEALEPASRFIEIPVVYGGAAGPALAVVAAQCGLSE